MKKWGLLITAFALVFIHIKNASGAIVDIDATSLTASSFIISRVDPPTFEVGPLSTETTQSIDLEQGTYLFRAGGSFPFFVTESGTIDFEPRLNNLVAGRGSDTLVVNGLLFSVDATALSGPGFQIEITGVGIISLSNSTVVPLTFIPGEYNFIFGGQFPFSLTGEGLLDFDTALDNFVGGRGTDTLVVNGLLFAVNATTLSGPGFQIEIRGVGTISGSTSTTVAFTFIPGEYNFRFGGRFPFTLTGEGRLDFDTGLDNFVEGRGTDTLVVNGLLFAVDATALSGPDFQIEIRGVGTISLPTDTIAPLIFIPGEYNFIFEDQFPFVLTGQGLLDFDLGLDSFISGRWSPTLVVNGVPPPVTGSAVTITIDLTQLSTIGFCLTTAGCFSSNYITLSVIPGRYVFQSGGEFAFTVTSGGTIDFQAGLDNFVGGRGTSTLLVQGLPLQVDATLLSTTGFCLRFLFCRSSNSENLTLIPGRYGFQAGGEFPFTVTNEGLLDFQPRLNSFVEGRETSTLLVQGLPLQVDATPLSTTGFCLKFLLCRSNNSESLTLIPGRYGFQAVGEFPFTVTGEGLLDFQPRLNSFVQGRGTSTLAISGLDISVNAMALTDPNFSLTETPLFPTNTVATLKLIPGFYGFSSADIHFFFSFLFHGTIDFIPSLDNQISGRGTNVLTIGARTVAIDIKPGSDPNTIKLGSEGNVPVAIFSAPDFDATTVDPLSITLASAPVRLKGKAMTPMASLEDIDGDGLLDLVVHIDTTVLELSEDDEVAVLTGNTTDGTPIRGEDTVRVIE